MREGRHSTEGCRYTPLARVILSTAPLCLQNKPKRSILASQKAILLRSILSWHVKRASYDQKKSSNYAWIVSRAFQLLLKVHNFIFISAEVDCSRAAQHPLARRPGQGVRLPAWERPEVHRVDQHRGDQHHYRRRQVRRRLRQSQGRSLWIISAKIFFVGKVSVGKML